MKISKKLRCANPVLTVPSDISYVFGCKKQLVKARFASLPGKVLFLRVRWVGSLLGLWPLFDVWFLGRLISGSVWYRETKNMGDSCSQWIVHSYEAWQVPDERARTSAFATGRKGSPRLSTSTMGTSNNSRITSVYIDDWFQFFFQQIHFVVILVYFSYVPSSTVKVPAR